MPPNLSRYAGQFIGAASGIAACGLWFWVLATPQDTLLRSAVHMAVGILMMLLAMFAVIASLRGHGFALVIIFIVSFFPVGGYLLGIPHWLRWVGVSDLGFLAAGLMIMYSTRRAAHQASVTDHGDR
jgi:hypothetical protein